MVDWWQALLYLLAGGLVTVAASYATHYWTTKATREAEERHAKRRLEEEQRQAIRQLRRERMQPVLDYLDVAKRCAARAHIKGILDEVVYPRLNRERGLSPEQYAKVRRNLLDANRDVFQESRALHMAVSASSSEPALQRVLAEVFRATPTERDPQAWAEFGHALRSAEQLVEEYLAGAEPHESTPEEPSQET
jgi:hypothetical protein